VRRLASVGRIAAVCDRTSHGDRLQTVWNVGLQKMIRAGVRCLPERRRTTDLFPRPKSVPHLLPAVHCNSVEVSTVEVHVTHSLTKLGFKSRAQVATCWTGLRAATARRRIMNARPVARVHVPVPENQ